MLPRLSELLAILLISALILLVSAHRTTEVTHDTSAPKKISDPEVSSHAHLVRLLGEEKPLLKRREWKKLPPASLTKIIAAVAAVQVLSYSDTVVFSQESKAVEERRSKAAIGESFSLKDTIRLLLMGSFNDAALAMAEKVGRKLGAEDFEDSFRLFTEAMNDRARLIGMTNSHFTNPTGLDVPEHYSSAEDLVRLTEYTWQNYPWLWEISRTGEVTFTSKSGQVHTVSNTNILLQEFPKILGGKTGFTDMAGGALLLLYPADNGKVAIIAILKSQDRFQDGRRIIQWLKEVYGTGVQ